MQPEFLEVEDVFQIHITRNHHCRIPSSAFGSVNAECGCHW